MTTPQAATKYYEQRFVNDFRNELERKKISLPVTVVLKDSLGIKQVIRNVSGARVLRDRTGVKSPTKIKSEELGRHVTSKADIALYSIAKDGTKVDVAWISHKSNKDKDGKKITHAQYLDVSADVNFKTKLGQAQEIKDFKRKMIALSGQKSPIKYCWPKYKDGVSLRIWDPVKSSILMNMAIFGVEFGKEYGRQNANILMVGDPHIEIKDENTIIFTAKDRSLANGFAEYLPIDDKPIFFTKPTAAAKSTIDGKTIEGVSVWIIYRSYASAKNKMIDDVISRKNALVSSSCGDKNANNNNNARRKKLSTKESEKREKEAMKETMKREKEAMKETMKREKEAMKETMKREKEAEKIRKMMAKSPKKPKMAKHVEVGKKITEYYTKK